jgi:hypothetical protein
MFDLNESQRYVHEYEEMLKKPGYTPTPAMKQRYEEEKAAIASTQSVSDQNPPDPYPNWGNVWPGVVYETSFKSDNYGWIYIRSPIPKTGEMEPIIPDPRSSYYLICPRWETPKEEFIYKIDRSTVWAAEAEKITWKKEE